MRVLTRQGRGRRAAALAAALAAAVSTSSAQRTPLPPASPPIVALAPVDVLASGFRRPSGIVVEASGAVLVADRAAGTLTRIGSDGVRELVARQLHQPGGVAVDSAGTIFVLESAARRVVSIDPGGHARVVVSTPGRPDAIVVGPDDRVWVAVRRHGPSDDQRDDDERETDGAAHVVARVEDGRLRPVAEGLVGVTGLAASNDAVYVAMTALVGARGRERTRVARLPLREDGAVGALEPLRFAERRRPWGVAVDALGSVFVGAAEIDDRRRGGDDDDDDRERRAAVIRKWADATGAALFARGLTHPAALAFAPDGDLLVVEQSHPARVLRFRAPPPPEAAALPFTNRTPLPIMGLAQPGDLVQVFRSADAIDPLSAAMADEDGAFAIEVPLVPNARTEVVFRATAAGGRGLPGAAAAAVIVHDDVLPSVTTLEPPPGANVRGPVVVRGRAEDDRSGVAALTFLLDDETVAVVGNPAPPETLVASATVDTGGVAEGHRTLTAVAKDRAGNSRAEAQVLVVDRTPPETVIVSGPGGETAERSVRFTLGGADVWSTVLEYSWRLDAGAWSPFGPSTVVELTDLTPGMHRFEARARDLAGNEDPTPAGQTFTVRSLRVRILEPVEGATLTAASMWVRGVVEGGTGEVTVRLVVPPGFGGTIAAPVEAGAFAIEVPADPAFAALTVLAADGSGATAQASVSVLIAPDGTSAESLELWPPGGLAPLGVRLGLHGFSQAPLAIDVEGDGADDFEGVVGADDFSTTYTRAGIYVPTVRVMTPNGLLVRRGLVEVYDLMALDARLQAVWAGFKEALRAGDVDGAVAFIVAARREAWADYLRALPADVLRDVDAVFPGITFTDAGFRGAQYEMQLEQGGVTMSYAVWFQVDADGRWRLSRF